MVPFSLPLRISCCTVRDHAKLLWQRIPSSVKQESQEIRELWEIGKRLWRRDFPAVYELARNPAWPSHLNSIVSGLVGNCEWMMGELCYNGGICWGIIVYTVYMLYIRELAVVMGAFVEVTLYTRKKIAIVFSWEVVVHTLQYIRT